MSGGSFVSGQAHYETRPGTTDPWVPMTANYYSSWSNISLNHYPLNTQVDDGGPWDFFEVRDTPTFGVVPKQSNFIFNGEWTVGEPTAYAYIGYPAAKSNSQLNAAGTTAVARCEPTNPAAQLSVALGEFMGDGIPAPIGMSLLKDRTKRAKDAGGEYLNVQFGWLPLVSDVVSIANAVKDSHKILHQYRRDSDRKIRRGYVNSDVTKGAVYRGAFLGSPLGAFVDGVQSEEVSEKLWFKGAFRYHIPTSDAQLNKFEEYAQYADRILGVRLTPEVLWNLAPWSWAVDWFTNTGDVLHNISALGHDGLVMQYGYVMHERKQVLNRTASYLSFGTPIGTPASRKIVNRAMRRVQATPYGFGFNLTTLSPRQTAILVALGLSH